MQENYYDQGESDPEDDQRILEPSKENRQSVASASIHNEFNDYQSNVDDNLEFNPKNPSFSLVGVKPQASISKRVNAKNSAVKQLKQVIKSLHTNQRIAVATIEFDRSDFLKGIPISIDGVSYENVLDPITKMEITPLFRYQDDQ